MLVAAHLEPVAKSVQTFLDLGEPYHDPGVGEFGLENSVFAVGDTFLEVISPVREDTTAGRYLARRGGDAGYMAIFQVPDLPMARRRIADLGVRVVWQMDLPDVAGTHLHPRDVPGAIVSVDAASPPESWRWAGPEWTGGAPKTDPGVGIQSITVATLDPAASAARWAAVLACPRSGTILTLDSGQEVHFEAVTGSGGSQDEGISAITLSMPGHQAAEELIAGVRIRIG